MAFAAVVWHYWLGIVLLFASVLTVVGVVVGYLLKVQSMKYPRRQQR